MASIEINLNEYNALRQRIEELEKENIQLKHTVNEEMPILQDKVDDLEELIEGVSLTDRLLGWGQILKLASGIVTNKQDEEIVVETK